MTNSQSGLWDWAKLLDLNFKIVKQQNNEILYLKAYDEIRKEEGGVSTNIRTKVFTTVDKEDGNINLTRKILSHVVTSEDPKHLELICSEIM